MEKPFCETLGDPELLVVHNQVLLRDNYTCQHCGSQKREFLETHHIEPTLISPEKKYDEDKMITHCMWCHAWEGHKHDEAMREKILARYAIKLHLKYVRPTDKETMGSLPFGNS